jgi:hypothetical protein
MDAMAKIPFLSTSHNFATLSDDELATEIAVAERQLVALPRDIPPHGLPEMTAAELADLSPAMRELVIRRGDHLARPREVIAQHTRRYIESRLLDFRNERALRQRSKIAALPSRFPPEWLRELKARADGPLVYQALTGLLPHRVAADRYRSSCPLCNTSARSQAVSWTHHPSGWVYWCFRAGHGSDCIGFRLAEMVGLPPPPMPQATRATAPITGVRYGR